MGTNTTPDKMRGFIIPTSNITSDNIWAAQSTFTEQNPRAGIAKAQQDFTGLTLSMAGEQAETITVQSVQGGLPGVSGAFVWHGEDEIKLDQSANNVITDFKFLKNGSLSFPVYDFDAVATDDGTLYFIHHSQAAGGNLIAIRKQKRNGSVENVQTLLLKNDSSLSAYARPSIAQLKDGSLIACYFDYTASDRVNLNVWRSIDGDNWTLTAKNALIDSYILVGSTNVHIDTTSLIVSDDTVTLLVGSRSKVTTAGNNGMVQYISRDSGMSFYTLGNYGEDHAFPVGCALPDGQTGFAYLSGTGTLSFIKIPYPGIAAARGSYTTDNEVEIDDGNVTYATETGTVLQNGSVAMWYQDEKIYVAAKSTTNEIYGFVSKDLGENWEQISQSNSAAIEQSTMYAPESATTIDRLNAVLWEGRPVIMVLTDYSLGAIFYGGYSSVIHPGLVTGPSFNQFSGYERNWFYNQLPDTSNHFTVTGSGSASLLNEGLKISTDATSKYYTTVDDISPERIYRFKMRVDSGGDTGDNKVAVIIESSDATASYTLILRFRPSGFTVRDHDTQYESITADMTNTHEFFVFQDKTDVFVYYREWDEKQAKKWTELIVTLGTTASGGNNQVRWGHIAVHGFPIVSYWSEFHIGQEDFGSPHQDARGCLYPSVGKYTYIDEGLLLGVKDSPARADDQYIIDARSDFPVDNIFHEVALSPRVVWRSKNDTTNERIAWYTDSVIKATANSLGLSDVVGLHFSNINWRTATLKQWTGASWEDLIDIDTSSGLSGTFKRYGSTIVPNASAKEFYLKYNEANGWRAELTSGQNTYIVKIKQNSEGLWSNANDAKQATLVFDTNLTDPSTLPTNGTIKLLPTSCTLIAELFHGIEQDVGNSALAIEIDSMDTLEGYFQIGTMLIGNVYFMSPQYQRGRSISYNPNVTSYETNDGQYYARKMSDGRRTFNIAWTEPVDTRSIHSLNPDYWQFSNQSGAVPVAHYGDSVFGMMGIQQYLTETTPVVYLPSISKNTSEDPIEFFNRYHNQVMVRINGSITMDSVLGEEETDEMFRLATVNLVEIE
jgi:hypothetical protein